MNTGFELMMKCDMCYDRTSVGKKPMCATVCPSDALYFGPREEIEKKRQEKPINNFKFGEQEVRTKVNLMTSPEVDVLPVDVADFMVDTFKLPEDHPRTGAPNAADLAVWDSLPEIVQLAKSGDASILEK